jgi:Zn-dependent M28 family amino/carboxypeptidase
MIDTLTSSRTLGCARAACAALLLLAGAGAARAQTGAFWVPAQAAARATAVSAGTLYRGMAGSLLAAAPGRAAELERLGAQAVDLRPGETAWIYLVEDAARAELEPPARVLLRLGHEVLVATGGDAPRLTARSEASLRGLKQLVRLPAAPVAARPARGAPRAVRQAPRAAPRAADPLIQDMVASLAQADYTATWQALDDFENRHTFASQNDAATQWILERFQSFGLRAEFHYYQQSGQRRNVIATLPGAVDSTQVVYLCAHLDATSRTPGTCAPGADDNGSGTAAVLEAARVLSQHRFQYTLKFAAFNGEEQGLVGSAAYVADIAAAGEDVLGVFNLDMVGYPGTDPAPPDLVIYTDAASLGLATTLADAASTYLPDLLEPVVQEEALGASDHASFWAHGYDAVLGIEAQAWSDDFNPWYHTCDDRIERYPQDYALYCARADLAAAATLAIPFAPTGAFLALGPVQVDDDAGGGSSGNGDGNPNPGETLELVITVRNPGIADAVGVSGVLRSLGPRATVLDSTSTWNDIPQGGQGANLAPLRVSVAPDALDGEELPFLLLMTEAGGSHPLELSLRVVAPVLALRARTVDDQTSGNGNKVPDPGEPLLISVVLQNAGGQDASGVVARLASASPHLTVVDDEASAPLIPAGGQATLGPAYRVLVSPEAADGEDLAMSLSITADQGYAAESGFEARVGTFFLDRAETDEGWSLAAFDDNAISGRWVRVDPNGTFENGEPVQPEDDHTPDPGTMCFVTGQGYPGGSASGADVDGGKTTLTSPVFDLTGLVNARVSYWRWYTNDLDTYPGEDPWLVQVSNDGGSTWVDLERTTASANSWQRKSFLLASYIVPSPQVVFRFAANDSGAGGSLVEAAVDDFEIEGDLGSAVAVDRSTLRSVRLDPPRPNPAAGGAAISFGLPADGAAVLRLYGVDGRLVRTLLAARLPAGPHVVVWDGNDEAGRRVAAGIYFCRLQAAGLDLRRRLSLLR